MPTLGCRLLGAGGGGGPGHRCAAGRSGRRPCPGTKPAVIKSSARRHHAWPPAHRGSRLPTPSAPAAQPAPCPSAPPPSCGLCCQVPMTLCQPCCWPAGDHSPCVSRYLSVLEARQTSEDTSAGGRGTVPKQPGGLTLFPAPALLPELRSELGCCLRAPGTGGGGWEGRGEVSPSLLSRCRPSGACLALLRAPGWAHRPPRQGHVGPPCTPHHRFCSDPSRGAVLAPLATQGLRPQQDLAPLSL